MNFFYEYGIFLLKTATFIIAIFLFVAGLINIAIKNKQKEKLLIKHLNKKYQDLRIAISEEILPKNEFKKMLKKEEKPKKMAKKGKRIFVLDFKGDIKASAVQNFREEITAVLKVATNKDEVAVMLESPGGLIHSYGLAASQLQRIRERNIPLTVLVDKIAASGGYLMASVADKICAAPFAIIGSIGVIGQLPNFHRLLKKHDIDYEQVMAGEYKRTLTLFGENTEKARQKFQDETNEAHQLFKDYILQHRPNFDSQKLATGEYWYGSKALQLGLIDAIVTSDDYLLEACNTANIYMITYVRPVKKMDKFATMAGNLFEKITGSFR
jgi:serine protease SohB